MDKYADLRAALPELMEEARRQGGTNPRAQMIIDLLAERDALREALQSIVDCCDEDHAARDYSSRQTEIRGIARYALAQEQGENNGATK